MKLILTLVFLLTLSCAKTLESFVLEIPVTYPEEKHELDRYPVVPVNIESLND